jgi:hypothetical protein
MGKRTVPRADESCVLSRVVERDGPRLEVWPCSDPRPSIRGTRQPVRRGQDPAQAFWPGCENAWHDQMVVPGEEGDEPVVSRGMPSSSSTRGPGPGTPGLTTTGEGLADRPRGAEDPDLVRERSTPTS